MYLVLSEILAQESWHVQDMQFLYAFHLFILLEE